MYIFPFLYALAVKQLQDRSSELTETILRNSTTSLPPVELGSMDFEATEKDGRAVSKSKTSSARFESRAGGRVSKAAERPRTSKTNFYQR